ncbi:hypothetical protein [Spirochaeta isovalerica]|uniref:Lipoprotein n=1 Tax=Spirochaeta isovalerica TaxID=150 RepID=A0A841R6C2_9SPIO|nr:hypothetical protein [Spirochaeta isovalerica]MBB6479405.1 hypothetical protein [Spirochaeta isovalerica]
MRKSIVLFLSLLFGLTACATQNKTVLDNNVRVLTPEPVAEKVIHDLNRILPHIDFQYSDRIDESRKGNYLIIAVEDQDNRQVIENSRFLFGPGSGPDHGFGGSYNGRIYFTYLEISTIDNFTGEFEALLHKGNFFPPELMDLFRDNSSFVPDDTSGTHMEKKPEERGESDVIPTDPDTVPAEEIPQVQVSAPVDESPQIDEEKKLAWNDTYPLGDLVESDRIVKVELDADIWSGSSYKAPILGPLVQFDKAGPELFIFVNHEVFSGKGHLRGLQFIWEKDENESKLITPDLTGSEVVVKNAEFGEESGFDTQGNGNWQGGIVYQLFCGYNPREYWLTYIEYEYNGVIYMAGDFSGELNVRVADQVTKESDRWFWSDKNLNGYFVYCLMEDGSIARYGFENKGFDTDVKEKDGKLLLNNYFGRFINGDDKGMDCKDASIVRILDAVQYDPGKSMEMLDQQIIDNYMNR